MTSVRNPYRPSYAVRPGRLLEEYIESADISARELARRCGRSAKMIVEIIAGKAPIEPETALQLERVLGMGADVWLNMESAYRLSLAKAEEDVRLSVDAAWAARFPLKELRKLGVLGGTGGPADDVRQLLAFFGAGSVASCRDRFAELAAAAYRHSPSFESDEEPLLTWLRLGEIAAERLECADYDRARFVAALREARGLTTRPIAEFLPEVGRLCAGAGVAFVVVRSLRGVALSGASRWLSPRRPLIQQSMRHMANDHFWFTFFHEAAHVLLHSRKPVFVDGVGRGNASPEEEREANEWAANLLVPQSRLDAFAARFDGSAREVVDFSASIGIAPGIVVGQLQKRGVVPFSRLNDLKERYRWSE